jgi:hypothetical protein
MAQTCDNGDLAALIGHIVQRELCHRRCCIVTCTSKVLSNRLLYSVDD